MNKRELPVLVCSKPADAFQSCSVVRSALKAYILKNIKALFIHSEMLRGFESSCLTNFYFYPKSAHLYVDFFVRMNLRGFDDVLYLIIN